MRAAIIDSAYELRADGAVYRLASEDVRTIQLYDGLMRVLDTSGNVEIQLPGDQLSKFTVPTDLEVIPVSGPEPEVDVTPWLTEEIGTILVGDNELAERRWADGALDPERVCECGLFEMGLHVLDDGTTLVWRCKNPEHRLEKPAWPLPSEAK
ncbi:hypothetical protein [Gryllotalpicola protaetiae]|uniref:Uncharacterized protein n=1 Tax=Gryllotalpicola protaetiae TaxID=2419771 RepID=A0A387BJN8_9MICO|nr:hypothetical protein [Gryllotalpicola protaetiae]AYG04053.1 hypothetical protein D7I44_11285 [Gryllotalpicola protaetiae]